MSLPAYPKYRESGVEWLGEVPEHWAVSRLGFESWVRARLGWKGLKADEYVDDGFVFLSTPNIKGREIDFKNVNYIDQDRFDESPEIQLSEGDVLLAKDGSTLGTVNVVRTLPRPTTVNSSIAVITPYDRMRGGYLFRLFESNFMENTIQRIKGGMGVPHLFQADLNKFYLPVPPLAEQAAIAGFLDRETAKIDGLVAEQRRLIGLLTEKRRAVISHAVTKGLHPDARMKDSGIEWLGEVPEHWTMPPLSFRYECVLGKMLDEKRNTGTSALPYLRNIDVQWDHVRVGDLPQMDIDLDERERFTVRLGDLLVCEGGEVGRTAIWRNELAECGFQKAIHRLRPQLDTEVPRYQFYVMKFATATGVFTAQGNPNTIPHLTGEKLRAYRFPCPPKCEQVEISAHLDKACSRLDQLIEAAETASQVLQERRTALISAAVTGKIDVRGVAPADAATSELEAV